MAASDDSITNELHDLVSCAICLDHFEDPRLLPCSHTYCYKCIQRVLNSSGNLNFECPLRDGIVVGRNEIATLPVNRTVKNIVEFARKMGLSNQNLQQQQHSKCDNCDETPAVSWCAQCNSNYCEKCSKSVHSMRSLQSHHIIPMAEKGTMFCTYHPKEEYKYWCDACQLLICRDCVLLQHKNHDYRSTEDAAAEMKMTIHGQLQNLHEEQEYNKQKLDALESDMNQIERDQENSKHELDYVFAAELRALEERYLAYIEEFTRRNTEVRNNINTKHKDLEERIKLLKIQQHFASQLNNNSNSIQVLKQKATLFTIFQNEPAAEESQGTAFQSHPSAGAPFQRTTHSPPPPRSGMHRQNRPRY